MKKISNFPKGFKKSSCDNVKCVKFFSAPHPAMGDGVQLQHKVKKRWVTILKKQLGITFDLADTNFFERDNFDFKVTEAGITYRIYSYGEGPKSAQYALQIMKNER